MENTHKQQHEKNIQSRLHAHASPLDIRSATQEDLDVYDDMAGAALERLKHMEICRRGMLWGESGLVHFYTLVDERST